jgi:hypothetical protein
MRTKILFYGAIGFFYLGFHSQDSLLYFFFAIYLFSLSVCFFLYKRENRQRKPDTDLIEETDSE